MRWLALALASLLTVAAPGAAPRQEAPSEPPPEALRELRALQLLGRMELSNEVLDALLDLARAVEHGRQRSEAAIRDQAEPLLMELTATPSPGREWKIRAARVESETESLLRTRLQAEERFASRALTLLSPYQRDLFVREVAPELGRRAHRQHRRPGTARRADEEDEEQVHPDPPRRPRGRRLLRIRAASEEEFQRTTAAFLEARRRRLLGFGYREEAIEHELNVIRDFLETLRRMEPDTFELRKDHLVAKFRTFLRYPGYHADQIPGGRSIAGLEPGHFLPRLSRVAAEWLADGGTRAALERLCAARRPLERSTERPGELESW